MNDISQHIMCIGWPTIRRLAADGTVWFDELQCGAVADSELYGADIDALLNSAARIEALEAALQQVTNWVRQNPEANAGDRAGDELLDIVRSIAALDPE